MSILLEVCYEFFKTGLFAVGGGLATIPFLRDMCLQYGWFTMEQLSTMIAVSESTPGPMGVNMATYVGYTTAGIPGAMAATLSLVAPSIIVICIIAKMLEAFRKNKIVQGIFMGLRPAVVGFILASVVDIFVRALFDVNGYAASQKILDVFNWKGIVLFAAMLALSKYKPKLHPIFLIVIGAVVGIVLKF